MDKARMERAESRFRRNSLSGGHRLAVVAEIRSAEYLGLPWQQKFGQRRASACRGSGKLLSGGLRLAVLTEIQSAEDIGLP